MPAAIMQDTVLITGCSPGGIGYALCKEFNSKGLFVIATARNRESITHLESKGISTVSLDVTSRASIDRAKHEVIALTSGKLDVLVNNAGRSCTLPALDVPLDEARACLETNFFGLVAMTQAFAPLLIASEGLIINIGSVASIVPYTFGSVYNASKAAVHAYSNTLRLELQPYGVRVMVVVTGGVTSNFANRKRDLPSDSLYLPIAKYYEKRLSHSQEGSTPPEVYAAKVVAAALQSRPKKRLWVGNKSWIVWFVSTWIGPWVFDSAMVRMFGLKVLGTHVRAAKTP